MHLRFNFRHCGCLGKNNFGERTTRMVSCRIIFSSIWELICAQFGYQSVSKLVHPCKHSWSRISHSLGQSNINDVGSSSSRFDIAQKSHWTTNQRPCFYRGDCHISASCVTDNILSIKNYYSNINQNFRIFTNQPTIQISTLIETKVIVMNWLA